MFDFPSIFLNKPKIKRESDIKKILMETMIHLISRSKIFIEDVDFCILSYYYYKTGTWYKFTPQAGSWKNYYECPQNILLDFCRVKAYLNYAREIGFSLTTFFSRDVVSRIESYPIFVLTKDHNVKDIVLDVINKKLFNTGNDDRVLYIEIECPDLKLIDKEWEKSLNSCVENFDNIKKNFFFHNSPILSPFAEHLLRERLSKLKLQNIRINQTKISFENDYLRHKLEVIFNRNKEKLISVLLFSLSILRKNIIVGIPIILPYVDKYMGFGTIWLYLNNKYNKIDNRVKRFLTCECLNLIPVLRHYVGVIGSWDLSTLQRHYALRSAVAAIMSRNMSHNIGSHVLAYLKMEKLVELAVRLVWKEGDESIEKIKGLIKNICECQSKICNFADEIQRLANSNDSNEIRKKVEEFQKALLQERENIENILNDLTGGSIRWGLAEWVRDTQNFFGYLQHRMDFLAQVSTEWPEWTFSAYLMKDIMREFLSQRHLLDGIAKSEGLRGFYYDWETGYKKYLECKKSTGEKVEEYGKIKFHVLNLCCFDRENNRKKEKVEKVWNQKIEDGEVPEECRITERINQIVEELNEQKKRILLHTKEQAKVNIEEGDIQIAIPGGIIGYHAFYVIIENIIRNSAKHSYTKYKNKIKDLEIMIEFTDDPHKPDEMWLFRIYDNVSFAPKGNNVKGERFRIFSEDAKDEEKTAENDLVAFMNECLRHAIIKETGELDKRHWGMAEMKIAAGYLQGREIQDIGAEGDKITGSEENQNANKEDFIIRAVESPIGTLGFEFKVRKPKEVGIVCYEGHEKV